MNPLKLSLILVLLLSPLAEAKSRFFLTSVQLGAARFKPTTNNWNTSTTFEMGWAPLYDFRDFAARGELSFSWPQDASDTRFMVINYQGYIMVPLYSFVLMEAGAGFQTWRYEGSTTNPVASLGIALRVGEWIDRVYICYSRYFLPNLATDEIRSGLAINLF